MKKAGETTEAAKTEAMAKEPETAKTEPDTTAAATAGGNATTAVIPFPVTMDAPARRRLADLPDRVMEGDPHHESQVRYTGGNGALQAGTWTSTPGRWRAFTDRDEFCTILVGRVALVAATGERQEFGPGDSFLIPDGFEGFWDVMETATKHFVILHREPDRADRPSRAG